MLVVLPALRRKVLVVHPSKSASNELVQVVVVPAMIEYSQSRFDKQ